MQATRKNRRKTHKKLLITAAVIVALIAISAVSYALFMPKDSIPTKNKEPSSENQPSSSNSSQPDNQPASSGDTSTKTPTSTTPDTTATPQDSSNSIVTITSPVAGTAFNRGDNLHIATLIQGVGTGTCSLTLSLNGSASVTQQVAIQSGAQSSTCEGFDITTGSMTTGTWKISVTATINNVASTTTGNVIIR